jgi:ribose transport system ATP-binding protein
MPVACSHLSKRFPGTLALDDVSMHLADGEVHALLGANGSGKSTLARTLAGVYQPDGGEIEVRGRRFDEISSPVLARKLGIAVVHQEAPLVDSLSVAECVALFRGYPSGGGLIRWRRLRKEVRESFERLGIEVDPGRPAGDLSPAERALVALAIALDGVGSELSLLVLDEATASLPQGAAQRFLEQAAAIATSGVPVLLVTHRLDEVDEFAAGVTILRDGRVVHDGRVADLPQAEAIRFIVGAGSEELTEETAGAGQTGQVRRLWEVAGREVGPPADASGGPALEIRDLRGETIDGLTATIAPGEVVGFSGLADSGLAELPGLLAGALDRRGGEIVVGGIGLPRRHSPRAALAAGMALLPADRLRSGGVGSLSIAENTVLPEVPRYWGKPGREKAVVDAVMDALDVRPRNRDALFGGLSGGNQQKVLLGKWLLRQPRVLVLDDPTSGVDPGARRTIFEMLRDATQEGISILFFSTEPEQLANFCDRVLVLRDGAIGAELKQDELSHDAVAQSAFA